MEQVSRRQELVWCVVLAFLVGVGWFATRHQSVANNGPLSFVGVEASGHSEAGVHSGRGEVVFGATTFENHAGAAATLLSARLIGPVEADDAEVVESRDIRLIDGKGTLIGAAVWPYGGYERRSHPLVGSTAAPHATYELLLVVRVHGPGVWRWPQTELTYRLRGRTYRTVVDFGFSVCPHRVQC